MGIGRVCAIYRHRSGCTSRAVRCGMGRDTWQCTRHAFACQLSRDVLVNWCGLTVVQDVMWGATTHVV